MIVYAIEERTPSMQDFETFMICSELKKAQHIMALYSKNYKENEYKIRQHLVDDDRLIEMEL